MSCTTCGAQNRGDARFCAGCGESLALVCVSCERPLPSDARFCDGCGAPVASADAGLASSGDDDAVRKVLTVLFCDVVGSTSFAEQVDAEAARDVMARYHAVSKEVIEAHDGSVAKFIGDGVMATFGLPEVADDDAERAVLAGLELQERFEPIRGHVAETYGIELGLRVGINTGEVAIGEGDADLVGDVLNTAARLEGAAPTGGVLVGEDTWRLTRSTIDYDPGTTVEVKGKSEPLATHLASGASVEVDKATPFVGRDVDLGVLDESLRDAQQQRRSVLVTVIGAPGVGKTRLVGEFADRRRHEVLAFDLRCERAGMTTFEPIADLIRAAAGISASQPDEEIRTAITRLLSGGSGQDDRLTDHVASFVGTGAPPSTEESFYAVRRLCERLAVERSLLLVIDDIQWAEPRLLDLLEHLAEWVAAPVLIVGLARPELREVRPVLTEAGGRVRAVVALDGLDPAATRRLAAELLEADLPDELAERLGASTDGNPLFVRELVRMLVDDQILVRTGDHWELAVDLEAVEVPPTIQSLLAARVERLPADERRLVELASVVGSEFALGAVVDLAGVGVAEVSATIERLRRKDILESTGTYRGDEPIVRFHHVLIRDAAYRRLLKKTRAQLHEQVGDWTERTSIGLTGDHEASIAHHLEQAHAYRIELGLGDPETAMLGERAAALLHAAAGSSLARDDLSAAAGFALRALALLDPAAPSRHELLLVACEALLGSGDVAGAADALAELATDDDPRRSAWAECFQGQVVTLTHPDGLSDAEVSVGAAAERLADLGDAIGVAKARQVRAGLLIRLGRVGEGEAELERSLVAARRSNDWRRTSAVLGAAPRAALWGPSPVARAGGRCLDIVRLVRIINGSPAVEATSWRCQAVLEALRGRFETARRLVDDARQTCEELGLHQDLMETELFAGIIELLAGDPVEAEPHLRTANDGLGRLGIGADLGQATAHLARCALLQGRVDDAEELAVESLALAGQNPQTAVVAWCARAEVELARGRAVEAVAAARTAVERLAGSDIVVDLANAQATLARALAAAGDDAGARSAAAEAHRLAASKGATVLVEAIGRLDATPADSHPGQRESAADGGAAAVRENAASRVQVAWTEALDAEDVDAAIALGADGMVFREHKRMVMTPADLDWPSAMRSLMPRPGSPKATWMATLLAVRDERWCLSRIEVVVDGMLVSSLNPMGIDESGRISHFGNFEVDDLSGAEGLLNEWWLERLPPRHCNVFRLVEDLGRAQDSQDLDRLVELTTSDVELVDHRQLISVGTLDKAGMVGVVPTRNAPGQVTMITDVPRLSDDGVVLAGVTHQEVDGVVAEFQLWWVIQVVDSLAHHIDLFDSGEEQAALARFDEVTAADATQATWIRSNASLRAAGAVLEALNAQDLDAALAVGADHVAFVDHRPLVSTPPDTEWPAIIRSLVPEPGERRDAVFGSTPLAVRGERWSLTRHWVDLDGMVIDWLAVNEVDEAGRITRSGTFAADDIVEAETLLDEWWLEGVDPACAEAVRVGRAFRDASDAADHEQLAVLSDDPLVFVDHRRVVGVGVEPMRSLCTDVDRLTPDGFVCSTLLLEEARFNAEYRFRSLVLVDDGRVHRLELFDLDDGNAFARFDELGAGGGVRRNAAVRAVDSFIAAMNVVDVEGAVALGAAGAMVDDRRRIAGSSVESWETVMRSLASDPGAPAGVWESIPLAVRGDRWSLTRARVDLEGMVIDWLSVTEVDESGSIIRAATFEIDDQASAGELLEEWWLADRTSAIPENAATRFVRAFAAAVLAGDLSDLVPRLAPEVTSVDGRRLVGIRRHGREEVVEGLESILGHGLAAMDLEMLAVRAEHLCLARCTARFEQDYTIPFLFLQEMREDGLALRVQFFDPDDLPRALDLLHEGVADGEGVPDPGVLEPTSDVDDEAAFACFDQLTTAAVADASTMPNAASAVVDAFVDAVSAGDRDAASALCAPNMVYREEYGLSIGNDWATALQSFFEPPFAGATWSSELLLTRGDTWCVHRNEVASEGNVIPFLVLTGVDETGTGATHCAVFLEEAFAEVLALLDEWALVADPTST